MGCASSSEGDAGQAKGSKSVFDVSGQQLSTLPVPQSATAPKVINASDNLLSRLPDLSASKAWVSVERVDFSRNRFTRVPQQLEALPKLTAVDFSSNPFAKSGAFDALLKLSKVTHVVLQDAGMKTIPVSLMSCRTITHLDLSSNPNLVLGGKGGPSLEKMVHLRTLVLRDCNLAGELPAALRNLKLTSLNISGNPKLDLSEPKSWGLLKKTLHELYAEELALFCLPRGVCSCTGIRKLSLRGNPTLESLSGLIFMNELTDLDLSDCGLRSLPVELDTAEGLLHLNLANNRLSADPEVPVNWWRWPSNASVVQLSVLAALSAVDVRRRNVEIPDPQIVSALVSCKDAVEISLCTGAKRNVLPMALASNLQRLASYNELPVADAPDCRARIAKLCSVTSAEDHLSVLPTAFATVSDGSAVRNLVDWLRAIHAARTTLGLMWPFAVARFKVFDDLEALATGSPRRKGEKAAAGVATVGDVPIDVAAVHLGLHLQSLLEPGAIVSGAPYLGTMAPADEGSARTQLWDGLIANGGGSALPAEIAAHGALSSHNPLDNAPETPEVTPQEDHARELVLRFAAHVVDAEDRGLVLDGAEAQYVKLLALPIGEARYLPLAAQVAAVAHVVMDPALFALEIGPLAPEFGGVDLPQVLVRSGKLFEVSDAALGRTSAAWDAEYKEHCPWLGASAKGCVASPDLLLS
uniref:Uncharacterized protein n=1 Tax=Neobodo designis TaxID=312471 RepID=A0A7S1MJP2_NEODS